MAKKAALYTLGCKVNTYESAEIAENLTRNGYLVVPQSEKADVIIINSCTVTGESGRKTRQLLRRLRREEPQAVIVLTGCLPQAFPDEAKALTQADIIIGNRSNARIPELLGEYEMRKGSIFRTEPHEADERFFALPVSTTEGHTRAFLKIQDGCNRFCSYCAIPYARGRSRSREPDDIERAAHVLAENGYRELVLVGIDLSDYGHDTGWDLADAVERVQAVDGLCRIRLGSLEPDHMTADMLDRLGKCEKLCPHFHISLQSGSDTVLKRMNRHYTASEFESLTQTLRARFPDCALTTDIICGFPGETEAEFLQTVDFVRRIRFEKVHIFPYSVREGTRAARMPEQLSVREKEERCARLSAVCDAIRAEYLQASVGKTVRVLFESPKNGCIRGYTENYLPVRVPYKAEDDLCGKIKDVCILSADIHECGGKIV